MSQYHLVMYGGRRSGTVTVVMSEAHRHVRPAAGVSGLGYRIHQLAADAEVAQLDVSLSVH